MDVSVEIHCAACGSAHYSLPGGGADDGEIVCDDCGRRIGTLAELKAELLVQALAHSADALRAEAERLRRDAAA